MGVAGGVGVRVVGWRGGHAAGRGGCRWVSGWGRPAAAAAVAAAAAAVGRRVVGGRAVRAAERRHGRPRWRDGEEGRARMVCVGSGRGVAARACMVTAVAVAMVVMDSEVAAGLRGSRGSRAGRGGAHRGLRWLRCSGWLAGPAAGVRPVGGDAAGGLTEGGLLGAAGGVAVLRS